VQRWKLAIQEFSFDIEYVKGSVNVAADSLSRIQIPLDLEDDVYETTNNHEIMNFQLEDTRKGNKDDAMDGENMDEIDREYICPIMIYDLDQEFYDRIARVHNDYQGHHGINKTLDILRNRHGERWKYMTQHVKLFIQQCPVCQKLALIKPIIQTLPFTVSTKSPMDYISIDYIGPLSESYNGKTHVLVMIDSFSRFVELFATKQPTAEEAANCLVEFVGRYGRPIAIRSDQGVEFDNKVIQNFCKLLDIHLDYSTAGSKEEMAICERVNREVLRHLRPFIMNQKVLENWPIYLPLVQRIHNSTVHSSLGVSPAQIIFGNSVFVERKLFIDPVHEPLQNNDDIIEDEEEIDDGEKRYYLTEYMDKMLSKQAEFMNIAKGIQMAIDERHEMERAPENEEDITEFPDNSYVLAMYPRSRFGRLPPNKLLSQWKGPLRVVSHIGTKYVLQNLVTNKYETFHIKSLKPFYYDPVRIDPREVALADTQSFDVEQIIDHRGQGNRRTEYEFLVRWVGHTAEDDTWEPWENVRNNMQLHAYLAAHRMKRFIPVQYKWQHQ
jgi:hypothetical protein